MKITKLMLLVSILYTFNACTTTKVVTKYIPCKYPEIIGLNYTNDTNYTLEDIEFEVIEEDDNETSNY